MPTAVHQKTGVQGHLAKKGGNDRNVEYCLICLPWPCLITLLFRSSGGVPYPELTLA